MIIQQEFNSVSRGAIELKFLENFLPAGDAVYVNPITGFLTSSRKMSAEDVAKYWSDIIFPDKSEESYTAHNPFAQARLLYVAQTIASYLKINGKNYHWCDFATGEGVLLSILRKFYPFLSICGTEHSEALVYELNNLGFQVIKKTLGVEQAPAIQPGFDISTLTWTLANTIDPLACVKDVVASTKIGGYVCVAESSRILVPFRKSLNDYFSKSSPADLHASNFSANTLRCLMQLSGLEIVFTNRYFDSDVLLVIGKKVDRIVEPTFFDNQTNVVTFMREWATASEFFENLRSHT